MAGADNNTKVCVLGHSYVRDLEGQNHFEGIFPDRTPYEIRYFYKPGSCFDYWLDWPEELHSAVDWEPNYIFFLLGGNSITDDDSASNLTNKANTFIRVLKNSLPSAIIIPIQIEARYLKTPHPRFGTPAFPEYRILRNRVNKFLQKNKEKHFLCIIAGPNNLDREEYYRFDKIHLTNLGNKVLLNIILGTLRYAYKTVNNLD